MPATLQIPTIDARSGNLDSVLKSLRERIHPQSGIVSEAGKHKTIEVFGEPLTASQVVERICTDVKSHGLSAVLDYSKRLDNADITSQTLRIATDQMKSAHDKADPAFLRAVRRIRDNIKSFQAAILHREVRHYPATGVELRQGYTPLKRVACCIPGGAAAYPSTLLMTVAPAQVAGVKEIVVLAPPTPYGAKNQNILALCHELGITELYQMGGAQAVAAVAYGVEGVKKVDKVVGPGNQFVALAKRHVFGEVDIDSIAGPSEIVVIADESTRADFAAADMLAQAEHAPGSSLLVTWSPSLAEKVTVELARQIQSLDRADLTKSSIEDYSAILLVNGKEQAIELTNALAPEHLHVATSDPQALLPHLTTAGAIFIGPYSPVALGDYFAGPSHVLPTGATAHWASGLSANSFLRSFSVIHYNQQALASASEDIATIANVEGLTAHRESIQIRNS
jgi:histidinol dehydrogenase